MNVERMVWQRGFLEQFAKAVFAVAHGEFHVPALLFTPNVVEGIVNIACHFDQQVARGLVEGVGVIGIERENPGDRASLMQGQGGQSPASILRRPCFQRKDVRIMLKILAPDRAVLKDDIADRIAPE